MSLFGRLPYAPLGPQAIREMARQKEMAYMPRGGGRTIPASGRVIQTPGPMAELGGGLAAIGQVAGQIGEMRKAEAAQKQAEIQRQGKIGAVRKALFGDQKAILASHGGPTNAAAAEMRAGNALGLDPEIAQAVMGLTEADPDFGYNMVSSLVEARTKQQERKMIKGRDGYMYYMDDGSRVLPNVKAPVDYNKMFLPDGSLNQRYIDAQKSIRGAGAPTTNVNLPGPVNPQDEIFAKQGAEAFSGYIETGKKAQDMTRSFKTLRGLANMAEIKPGARVTLGITKSYDALADFFGAPTSEALGVDPNETGAKEAITGMVNNLVLQYKNVVGLGSQGFTEGDRMFLEEVFPRLGDTEIGFDIKLQALEGIAKQQVWTAQKAVEFRNTQRRQSKVFDDADFQDWLGKQDAPSFFAGLDEKARRAGLINDIKAYGASSAPMTKEAEVVDVDSMTFKEMNDWRAGLTGQQLVDLPTETLEAMIRRLEDGK